MEFIKGNLSAIAATTILYPIDTVKTQYQVVDGKRLPTLIREIYKKRGFYNGLPPHLMTYPIFWGAFFEARTHLESCDPFTKSFLAGCIGSIIANPFFVIKTRQQMDRSNPNMFSVAGTIYKKERFGSFYKGLGATLINNLKLGIQFPLYDLMKERDYNTAVAAATSKLVSTSLFYPSELIRIKQRDSDKPISFLQMGGRILQSHGIRGLYKGVLIYNILSTLNFVLMMGFKELI